MLLTSKKTGSIHLILPLSRPLTLTDRSQPLYTVPYSVSYIIDSKVEAENGESPGEAVKQKRHNDMSSFPLSIVSWRIHVRTVIPGVCVFFLNFARVMSSSVFTDERW